MRKSRSIVADTHTMAATDQSILAEYLTNARAVHLRPDLFWYTLGEIGMGIR
jgi:hypothetical protein